MSIIPRREQNLVAFVLLGGDLADGVGVVRRFYFSRVPASTLLLQQYVNYLLYFRTFDDQDVRFGRIWDRDRHPCFIDLRLWV